MSRLLGVIALDEALTPQLQELASRLNLPLLGNEQGFFNAPGPGVLLVHTGQRLELRSLGKGAFRPVAADPLNADIQRRIQAGRQQALPRALGLHKKPAAQVLDATAGLGRDSMVLAGLGARVSMLERNPLLHALLEDALRRASTALQRHCSLLPCQDGADYLRRLAATRQTTYDAIYLDPMYPDEQRHALPKREMQLLRQILGNDGDADCLLPLARDLAARVVVKRAPHAPLLAGAQPSHQLSGNRVRYDIYVAGL